MHRTQVSALIYSSQSKLNDVVSVFDQCVDAKSVLWFRHEMSDPQRLFSVDNNTRFYPNPGEKKEIILATCRGDVK